MTGVVANRLKRETDTLIPLPKESILSFGNHEGFESTKPRESIVYKSHSFYWAEDNWCYSAEFGATEEAFAGAASSLQSIIDSITLTAEGKTTSLDLKTVDLTSVGFSMAMDSSTPKPYALLSICSHDPAR